MKKKKIIIMIIVIVLIVLCIPVKNQVKDGGSITYQAILYGITKRHSMTTSDHTPNGEFGYNIGIEVRILWFEIYNDVEFVPAEEMKK